jgi:branched-chain amino acid transport system ATP-binding protein
VLEEDSREDVVLVVQGVSKRFGGVCASEDVSLDVRRNEIFGLIGPNGAGKTTLFNVIAGAIRPDAGTVVFNGTDITGRSVARRCEAGLSRTFQNPRPFKGLTVLQNAMLGGVCNGRGVREAERRAADALNDVGLWHRRDHNAGILSLGQLKRLEIARCLATGPSLLLLDEVTGGLGPSEIDELVTLVLGLRDRGITMVMIEHNMRVALSLCQRIVVLNFGRIIAEGDGAVVTSHPEVIKAYLGDLQQAEVDRIVSNADIEAEVEAEIGGENHAGG